MSALKYNKLTIIGNAPDRITFETKRIRRRKRVICKCECGVVAQYDLSQLKSGRPKQCRECGFKSISKSKTKHQKTNHPLYRKWQDMKNRCYNKNTDRYENYGGRGITVCKEWKNDFVWFYNWCLESGWEMGLEIDRIDVNGNYTKDNCRIVTHKEQGYNKTNTRYVDYKGEKRCLAEILDEKNLSDNYHTVYTQVVRNGKRLEDVLNMN